MSKSTPSPWVLGKKSAHSNGADPNTIYDEAGKPIAMVIDRGKQTRLNGLLIQAAPDMASSIRALLNYWLKTPNDELSGKRIDELIMRLFLAVRKTESLEPEQENG